MGIADLADPLKARIRFESTYCRSGGRREELKHTLPGLGTNSHFRLSYDGRRILYTDAKINGSLVMIENLR